jgi:uncharacterized membrane protein YqjE
MSRHPLRWDSLVLGLFFLAIVAGWAVWQQDLLSQRELSLAASGVLIVLGVIGVAASLWQSRPTPAPSVTTTTEGDLHEEADPQD